MAGPKIKGIGRGIPQAIEKPKADQVKKAKAGSVEIQPEDVAMLFGKSLGALSVYWLGAPVWTASASAQLYRFVDTALKNNKLFAERHKAREHTAKKICKTIEHSKNLTARFYPHIMNKDKKVVS